MFAKANNGQKSMFIDGITTNNIIFLSFIRKLINTSGSFLNITVEKKQQQQSSYGIFYPSVGFLFFF